MALDESEMITLVIHWPRLGPYHLARLRATHEHLYPMGIGVIALEVASHDHTYAWQEKVVPTGIDRCVAFPGLVYEDISVLQLCRGLLRLLDRMNPDVVAISGYASWDARVLVMWCRRHGRPAILMTESKADDARRSIAKEWLKQLLISRFSAALCGGKPQRAYLKQLGMRPKQIYEGYDVVDNDFFWEGAEDARQNPTSYRRLPGLDHSQPFFLASARFIRRKNLEGLLAAYGIYRRACVGADLPWRLVILGDGVRRSALEEVIKDAKLDGVSLPGFRQYRELPAYYGLAAAFVHPALQDQWGLVVNEAMAAGLPVLVSHRSGSAADLVRDGENGFTFDPEDLEALAVLLHRFSSGQVDLAAMGQASRTRISQWGPERFAEGMGQALRYALSS